MSWPFLRLHMAKQVDNLSINVLFVDTKTKDYSEDQGDLFVFDFRIFKNVTAFDSYEFYGASTRNVISL